MAATSSHAFPLIIDLPYFVKLPELGGRLEINMQSPNFMYEESETHRGKVMWELVGQPGWEPRNLGN